MNAIRYAAMVEVNNGTTQNYHMEVVGLNPDDACHNISEQFKGCIGVDLQPVTIRVVRLRQISECEV